jgi:hypothetical protein
MKYDSTFKGKEILTYATMMNLENIVLSEISSSQKKIQNYFTYINYIK